MQHIFYFKNEQDVGRLLEKELPTNEGLSAAVSEGHHLESNLPEGQVQKDHVTEASELAAMEEKTSQHGAHFQALAHMARHILDDGKLPRFDLMRKGWAF